MHAVKKHFPTEKTEEGRKVLEMKQLFENEVGRHVRMGPPSWHGSSSLWARYQLDAGSGRL